MRAFWKIYLLVDFFAQNQKNKIKRYIFWKALFCSNFLQSLKIWHSNLQKSNSIFLFTYICCCCSQYYNFQVYTDAVLAKNSRPHSFIGLQDFISLFIHNTCKPYHSLSYIFAQKQYTIVLQTIALCNILQPKKHSN